jgi:ADP-ribosylglycohydrolase
MQRDRFRACLLAGAVGDALGGAVEFLSLAAIRATHGPAGIRDYAPAIGGQITDDTQMTLYTAAALLDAADADATAFARGDALVGRSLTAAYLLNLVSTE